MEGVGNPSSHLPLKRSIASTTSHSCLPPAEHLPQRQQLQGLVEGHLPLPPSTWWGWWRRHCSDCSDCYEE
jgi:hypothetical protein